MSVNKKKPISITLAATIVICIITFILGFVISSFAFLDSRLESANDKAAELTQLVNEKNEEIKSLKFTLEQKDENNIVLAEQIQTHLETIDSLKAEVSNLKNDVSTISEAAINSDMGTNSFFLSFAALTASQQLIILVLLLVILIFIISISCGFIAAKSSKKVKEPKAKKEKKNKKQKAQEEAVSESDEASELDETKLEEASSSEEIDDNSSFDEAETFEEEVDEPTMPIGDKVLPAVQKAIDLLYRNNLEDSISDLGGFKFGITNFDEILSDKRRPKSFGNSESGDFVAFMSSTETASKLYIIPRTLVLSDSAVSLRGVTDLFNIEDENGEKIHGGTVKIKEVVSPAVFSCGDSGWAIESKGEIITLNSNIH